MMSVALQEALTRLKAQERATAARAEASERLSSQIITGVGAGLIVVDRVGVVQIVNPAARRILSLDGGGEGRSVTDLLSHVAPLAQVITDTAQHRCPGRAPAAAPRRAALAPRRERVAAGRRRRRSAGGGLPVHRPDGSGGARGAAAPEGGAGGRRRADRRPRARVPERAGHHPRLRAAARSGEAARWLSSLRRGHSPGDRGDGRGGDELPQLREAGAVEHGADRPAHDRRAGGGRPAARARAHRRHR